MRSSLNTPGERKTEQAGQTPWGLLPGSRVLGASPSPSPTRAELCAAGGWWAGACPPLRQRDSQARTTGGRCGANELPGTRDAQRRGSSSSGSEGVACAAGALGGSVGVSSRGWNPLSPEAGAHCCHRVAQCCGDRRPSILMPRPVVSLTSGALAGPEGPLAHRPHYFCLRQGRATPTYADLSRKTVRLSLGKAWREVGWGREAEPTHREHFRTHLNVTTRIPPSVRQRRRTSLPASRDEGRGPTLSAGEALAR